MSDTPPAAGDPEPQPPREPEPWECCRSGCDPCVYDAYWDAVARYEAALEAWKVRRDVRNRTP
ncbi:MAG: oxidoreductase-like domain-containing protein [Burkholderiales bacterium]